MEDIQKYFPNGFPYSLGLANRNLFFEPSSDIGFRSGFENLDLFGYDRREIKYYRTRTPYTEIFALFGMKKEQFAKLLHTQNITKQWNIALNMLRLRNEGFYNRQNCTDNNMSISSNYTSKNNRYSLLANGIISSIKTDENGGVSDTVFENNLLANKKLIPVNLLEARTRRGSREFTVAQFLNFGKRDTASKADSSRKKIIPRSSLSYSFSAKENWFVYEDKDPASGFYENIFFDSALTHDSSHIFSFQNIVSWKSVFTKHISAEISFSQKSSRLVQYKADSMLVADTLFKDDAVHFKIGKDIRDNSAKGFYWNLGGKYIASGNHKGEHSVFGNLSCIFSNDKKVSLELGDSYSSIPFLYSDYSSNHFFWKHTYKKTYTTKAKLYYNDVINKFSLGAKLNQITGYVYFDSTFSPVQFDSTLYIYSAFIQKNFRLKKFYFNNKIIWQQASEDVMHLPEFITHHSLYYEDKWFKKVMDVQIGFDVTYFSSYYADAYMPALGLYYWQNEKKIGNYPFIDFFFNMKIRRARIFFKTEHVNSGFMGAYYLAPHNPAPDRSIKVGINWTFYD